MTTYNDIERSTTVPFWLRPENRHRPDNPMFLNVEGGLETLQRVCRSVHDRIEDVVKDGRERFPREDEQ